MRALRRPRRRLMGRGWGEERGSMSVEVVFFVPILVMFTLLVVAGGRYVAVKGDIEAAARDAARAASFARTADEARTAAATVATAALGSTGSCRVSGIGGNFSAGGIVEVDMRCEVSNRGLGLIGLGGTQTLTASGAAPIDTYRRYG
ncbi:TadE/TadG family type IV pilus assembly protein [Mumia sp. ZJ1417]|uniref:TadE/TadG family type IV pilus assembly protein n=2 Tax=Mumia TaxID=1546255 RepID=UPI001FB99B54|nr:TadE/TadG family type IV pilus assembly protein [Mumia sp. ZJ1417]